MSKVLQKNDRDVPGGSVVKNLPSNAEDQVQSPVQEIRCHVPWGNLPLHSSY